MSVMSCLPTLSLVKNTWIHVRVVSRLCIPSKLSHLFDNPFKAIIFKDFTFVFQLFWKLDSHINNSFLQNVLNSLWATLESVWDVSLHSWFGSQSLVGAKQAILSATHSTVALFDCMTLCRQYRQCRLDRLNRLDKARSSQSTLFTQSTQSNRIHSSAHAIWWSFSILWGNRSMHLSIHQASHVGWKNCRLIWIERKIEESLIIPFEWRCFPFH